MARLLARARPNIQQLRPYSSARLHSSTTELESSILLNANENPHAPPAQLPSCPGQTWDTAGYNYYPEPQPHSLVTALAALYGVSPAQVIVGRGSDEGIDLLLRAFCGEQDAIAICGPTFGMYRSYAEIQGCSVIDVPLKIEELRPRKFKAGQAQSLAALLAARLPLAALQQTIASEAPKLLFLPNPLAPLGTMIPNRELRQVLELCAQHDVLLVVDEAYAEFAQILEPNYQSCIALLAQNPNLVILRTLSKAYSLAGERIGSLLAAPELVQLLRPAQSPYPVPSSISRYVSHLLQDPTALQGMAAHLTELCQQHPRLFTLLEALPYVQGIFSSAANFIMVQVERSNLLQHCRKRGLILRDFSRDLNGALRISLGKVEQIDQLSRALKSVEFTL